MSELQKTCEEAARAGGELLLTWRHNVEGTEKGPRDFVTQADLESQSLIRKLLLERFPDHHFLGEEDGSDSACAANDKEYCWVVDPLDGTANFLHGLPGFAVSIALLHQGIPIVGAVYDPLLRECFSAACDGGAFLNGSQLKTSGCKALEKAMLAASFSPNVPRGSKEVTRFIELLHTARAIRRLGSAALNLCYVAAGRLDGYWATSVKIWDVAAGLLILNEAGGKATDLQGEPIALADPKLAVSASPELHTQLLAALSRAG